MSRAFPYVVGSPRSGTTLLRLMLNAHPELAIPPEAPFVVSAPAWVRDGERTVDAGRAANYFLSREWFPVWSIERDELAEAMRLGASITWAEAVRRVFGVYARTCGKALAGAKTPLHVLEIGPLSKLLEEARFVHVVRDGRNVALSMREAPFGPRDLGTAARHWRDHVQRGHGAGRRLGKRRYLEVRYEALVDGPERELRRVCSFLGFDFDPRMLRAHEQADTVLMPTALSDWHRNLSRPPTPGLRDWHSAPTADIQRIERIEGPTLRRFGYPVASVPLREAIVRRKHDVAVRVLHAMPSRVQGALAGSGT